MHYLWRQFPELKIAVPKIADGNALSHVNINSETDWQQGPWGIPEPNSGPLVKPANIEVVLVPLLSFDLNGHRIGYGKGFYDRFLAQCKPETRRIGVSFWGPGPKIIAEPTDVALHEVYTPLEVFSFTS